MKQPIVAEEHQTTEDVIAFLSQKIRVGLRHGHFEYSISSEVINSRRRKVVVHAGTSHMFIIPEKDLAR